MKINGKRTKKERKCIQLVRTLPPLEAEAVAAHIRDCGGCAGTARSLDAVREGLRRLPHVTAPPELLARVRDAVDRETGGASPGSHGPAVPPRGKSVLSRLRVPLEAAAAVLLVATIWWYQKCATPPPVPPAPSMPAGSAAPAPEAVPGSSPRLPEKTAKSPEPEMRPAGKAAETPPPMPPTAGKAEVASLPAGAPEPKPRAWSPSALPAAPAVRESSESAQVDWYRFRLDGREVEFDLDIIKPAKQTSSSWNPARVEQFAYFYEVIKGGLPALWETLRR